MAPFLDVDGLCNLRDCGGYPIYGQPGMIVRRGVLFRSADPSSLTAKGMSQLQALAISRVFDLRCDSEIRDSTAKGFGAVKVWHPAQRVSLPVFTDAQYAVPEHRTLRDQKLRRMGDEGFMEYYREILASAVSPANDAQPVKTLVGHLAASARVPDPILIHCSLGKDRTGVMCAVVLSLCGVPDAIVAHEYSLSAAGLEAKIASITAEIRPDGPGLTKEEARFFGSRKEAMYGFLKRMRHDHGSMEQYLLNLGVTTPDAIQQLRNNLVVPADPGHQCIGLNA